MNDNLFKTRLIEAMNNKNVKQADIVKNTGIAKSSLSQYLKGLVIPKQDKVYLLANYLNVNPSWLWGLDVNSDDDIQAIYSQLNNSNQKKVVRYSKDLLQEQQVEQSTIKEDSTNYAVEDNLHKVEVTEKLAAGVGYTYQDYNETFEAYTDRKDLKAYDIASFVTGDSMTPKYNNGDVVLIRNGYDNINGSVYAVDYDGKTFLKRVFFEGDRIRLVSYNKKYDDIIIYLPIDEDVYLNIVGRVVDSFTPVQQ